MGPRKGQAVTANMLWMALPIRYGPGISELTITCVYSLLLLPITLYLPFSLLRQCNILLLLSPSPHGFLSASPIPSLESCCRAMCDNVGCTSAPPATFIWAMQTSQRKWEQHAGTNHVFCAQGTSQGLVYCRGSTNVCGWISGWRNDVNWWCLSSSRLSSQMENPMSRGGKEIIPNSIPKLGTEKDCSPVVYFFYLAILSWDLGSDLLNLATKISEHWIL